MSNDEEDKALDTIQDQLTKTAESYRWDELALKKALVRWDYQKFSQRKGEVIFAGEGLADAIRTILKYEQGQNSTINPLAPNQVLKFNEV